MEIKSLNRMSADKATVTVSLDSDEITAITRVMHQAAKKNKDKLWLVNLFAELSGLELLVCQGVVVVPDTVREDVLNDGTADN